MSTPFSAKMTEHRAVNCLPGKVKTDYMLTYKTDPRMMNTATLIIPLKHTSKKSPIGKTGEVYIKIPYQPSHLPPISS
jgi:hypothetical protein